MTAYLVRRLGTSIIVLVGISIFIYLLLHAIYPSPARAVLGLRATNAQIAAWNKSNGFSRPVIEQYLSYMNALIHGNLGYSYSNNQTVASLFQERVARRCLPVRYRPDPGRPHRVAAGHLPGREAELTR